MGQLMDGGMVAVAGPAGSSQNLFVLHPIAQGWKGGGVGAWGQQALREFLSRGKLRAD